MLKKQLEALILASDEPISLDKLRTLLLDIELNTLQECLASLEEDYSQRGICLMQVAGGWQFRTAVACKDIVQQLWQTRPPRLSRSMLETLAIIAYQQPTTRAEIEALRGIKVSSSIIGGLMERGWIKVIGRKDVPGRPHLYATSKQFLIDFGLNNLNDLPDASQLIDSHDIQQAAQQVLNPQQAETSTEDNNHE